jgi:hypothetical protein
MFIPCQKTTNPSQFIQNEIGHKKEGQTIDKTYIFIPCQETTNPSQFIQNEIGHKKEGWSLWFMPKILRYQDGEEGK